MKTFKNMKNQYHHAVRRLLCAFTLASFSMALNAQDVDEETAMQRAQEFLNERGLATKTIHKSSRTGNTRSGAVNAPLYFFNIGNEEGFVVVSGDNRTREILGYTDSGNYDESKLPENAKSFFKSLEEQIKSIPADYKKPPVTRSISEKPAIAPLINTMWSQEWPYNAKCPYVEEYGYCVTGCVSTAMAQIFNYYQFPTTLPALDSYHIESYWQMVFPDGTVESPSINQTVGALPTLDIAYSNLKRRYVETDLEDENLSWLLRYCSQSVEMQFSPWVSGTFSHMIPDALKKFGFNEHVTEVSAGNYSPETWYNLICNELDHQRPVIYSGLSLDPTIGGHTFLCDGFDGDGMFHINWGWNGELNGFFSLYVLNPWEGSWTPNSDQFTGFNNYATAIIGIAPFTHTIEDGFPHKEDISNFITESNLEMCVDKTEGIPYTKHFQNLYALIKNTDTKDFSGTISFVVKHNDTELIIEDRDFTILKGCSAEYVVNWFIKDQDEETTEYTCYFVNKANGEILWEGSRLLEKNPVIAKDYKLVEEYYDIVRKADNKYYLISKIKNVGNETYPYGICLSLLRSSLRVIHTGSYHIPKIVYANNGPILPNESCTVEFCIDDIDNSEISSYVTMNLMCEEYDYYNDWFIENFIYPVVDVSTKSYYNLVFNEENKGIIPLSHSWSINPIAKADNVMAYTAILDNEEIKFIPCFSKNYNTVPDEQGIDCGIILKGIIGQKVIVPNAHGKEASARLDSHNLLRMNSSIKEVESHSVLSLCERGGVLGFGSYSGTLLDHGTIYIPKSLLPSNQAADHDCFVPLDLSAHETLVSDLYVEEGYAITNPIKVGHYGAIDCRVTPSAATNKEYEIISKDPSIATVNNNVGGLWCIFGVSPGIARLTVRALDGSEVSADTHVYVIPDDTEVTATEVTCSEHEVYVTVGGTYKANASIAPDSSNDMVTWLSQNNDIATIDTEGNLRGISEGFTVVTVYVVGTWIHDDIHVHVVKGIGYDGNNMAVSTENFTDFFNTAYSKNAIIITGDNSKELINNVIYREGDNYIADNMCLIDQQPFYCPNDVQTRKITYSRDFTNTNWQPMYVPFKISAEELEAAGLEVAKLNSAQMIDEDADGNAEKMQINFLRVKSGNTVPNKPYLVRAKTTGEHTVEISDATIYKTTVESVDCSTTEMEFTFTGTYEGVSGATILENNYYVMSKGTLCTAEDSSSDLKAFRWYMSLTPRYQYGTQVPRTRALISIDGENATTDIEDIFEKDDSRPDIVHISSQIIGLKPGEYRMNGKKMVVE